MYFLWGISCYTRCSVMESTHVWVARADRGNNPHRIWSYVQHAQVQLRMTCSDKQKIIKHYHLFIRKVHRAYKENSYVPLLWTNCDEILKIPLQQWYYMKSWKPRNACLAGGHNIVWIRPNTRLIVALRLTSSHWLLCLHEFFTTNSHTLNNVIPLCFQHHQLKMHVESNGTWLQYSYSTL